MTSAANTDLLRKIEAHRFDPAGAMQPFDDRLARENGWTLDFARRAIVEYRRYAFLYASSGEPVAPSDVVDQVWHLHLLYTRNYWDGFCGQVLGKPLHHEPATGVTGEQPKLNDWYASTLDRYREHFGEPPADIWPDAQTLARTPKPRMIRVNADETIALSRRLVVRTVVACAILLLLAIAVWAGLTAIG